MTARLSLKAALLLGAAFLVATPAGAQQDDRRVQRLEQQVKELRSIVFQGRDTGQPVVVKPAGPDPDVVALGQKVDEENERIRSLTGQIETLQHDLDESRRTTDQLKADADTRSHAVDDRLGRLEGQLATGGVPAPTAAIDPNAPPLNPRQAKSAALTQGAYAGDNSQFGGAPGPTATAPPTGDAFQASYKKLTDADYPGAQSGFEGWLAANPSSPRAGEARYYVGQSLYMRENYAAAARSYAEALKGWPKSKWAPEATVKLAQSLQQLDRGDQACAALSEFDRRYGKDAAPATKSRAKATRTAAKCSAA